MYNDNNNNHYNRYIDKGSKGRHIEEGHIDNKDSEGRYIMSQYNPVKGLYGSWLTPALYQGRSTRV